VPEQTAEEQLRRQVRAALTKARISQAEAVDGHVIPQLQRHRPQTGVRAEGVAGAGPPAWKVSGTQQPVKDAFGAASAVSCAHP
jgi:hypothetical protein